MSIPIENYEVNNCEVSAMAIAGQSSVYTYILLYCSEMVCLWHSVVPHCNLRRLLKLILSALIYKIIGIRKTWIGVAI